MSYGHSNPPPREEARSEASFGSARRLAGRIVARSTGMLLPAGTIDSFRKRREWKQWIDRLDSRLFEDLRDSPPEIKRALFRDCVTLVEIETHAKCNRVCAFCPNALQDRRQDTRRTGASLLRRVFEELGSIDYRRQIKVARYSEPLADFDYLCEQLTVARTLVPHAELAVVTNTDYLTRARLDTLRDLGLNRLYMSLYLRNREAWTPELAHKYIRDTSHRLGLRSVDLRTTKESVECSYEYAGVALFCACRNFDTYGTDRGAVITRYMTKQRRSPCREPFETFVIDYTGAVMPCCNLRSDMAAQKDFSVGSLESPGASIFDIYAGGLAAWRASMVGFGEKKHPCTTCLHRVAPDSTEGVVHVMLNRRLAAIGRPDLA